MISGESEEELIEAIGRTDVLLEFMPKIKQLQQENEQLKDNWNKLKEFLVERQKQGLSVISVGHVLYIMIGIERGDE